MIPQTTSPEKNVEEISRDINIQVLEIKYVINLRQLLKIVLDIKWYIFKLVKSIQPIQPKPIQLKLAYVAMIIDH